VDATARAVFKEAGPERTIGDILKSLNGRAARADPSVILRNA
jgi:hypothetical protein